MASMWRRAMLYLGLGPDDEYDDYDVDDEPMPDRRPAPTQSRYPAAPADARGRARARDEPSGSVRTIGSPVVRPQASAERRRSRPSGPAPRVVRPLQPVSSAKPHVVAPDLLQPRPRGRRQAQGQPAGDRQPAERRPRPVPPDHRLRHPGSATASAARWSASPTGVPAHAVQRRGLGRGAAAPPGARLQRGLSSSLPAWTLICLLLNLYWLVHPGPDDHVLGPRSRRAPRWRASTR